MSNEDYYRTTRKTPENEPFWVKIQENAQVWSTADLQQHWKLEAFVLCHLLLPLLLECSLLFPNSQLPTLPPLPLHLSRAPSFISESSKHPSPNSSLSGQLLGKKLHYLIHTKCKNGWTWPFKSYLQFRRHWAKSVVTKEKKIPVIDIQVNWTELSEEWDHGFFNFSNRSRNLSHNVVGNCGYYELFSMFSGWFYLFWGGLLLVWSTISKHSICEKIIYCT